MSSTFPLLRLPLLASKNVIKQINYREQYKLATLSKRMQWIIKFSTRVDDVEVELNFDETVSFIVKFKGNKYRIMEYKFRVWPVIPKMYPSMDILKKHIIFLRDTFNLQNISVDFKNEESSIFELEILPFLKQENLKIQDLDINCDDTNDKLYEHVLNEYKNARNISIWFELSPNFELPVNQCPQFSTDSIYIHNPKWITMDHLTQCFMNCKDIDLSDCKFTSEEINRFIRCWMDGSKVELSIIGYIEGTEFRSFLDGITVEPIEKAIIPRDSSCRDGDELMEFDAGNCFLITQTNGVEALVYKMIDGYLFLDTMFSLSRPVPECFMFFWKQWEPERNYTDDDEPTDEE